MKKLRISLAAARVNAELTQKDVCKALKITPQTIVNWEKGITSPTAENAQRLVDLYKLDMDDIIFRRKSQI